jgi:hypothetical protein
MFSGTVTANVSTLDGWKFVTAQFSVMMRNGNSTYQLAQNSFWAMFF